MKLNSIYFMVSYSDFIIFNSMNVMDLWFFIRIRETLDKNDLKILNQVFSWLVFLSVDKNYTDNNNLVVLHMKKKKKPKA